VKIPVSKRQFTNTIRKKRDLEVHGCDEKISFNNFQVRPSNEISDFRVANRKKIQINLRRTLGITLTKEVTFTMELGNEYTQKMSLFGQKINIPCTLQNVLEDRDTPTHWCGRELMSYFSRRINTASFVKELRSTYGSGTARNEGTG